MKLLNSYCEIAKIIKEAKLAGISNYSNYFPNPKLHAEWISKNELWVWKQKNIILLIHKLKKFSEIFFFSKDIDSLRSALESINLKKSNPILLEIINKSETDLYNLPVSKILKRMVRIGTPENFSSDRKSVIRADISYKDILTNIFEKNFHPAIEHIPDDNELSQLIENNCVYICNTENEIAGFIIFELVGSSVHLRYWWVNPLYRNQGVGSSLMSLFFEVGKNTVRQFLWVFDDNENAIKRYKHYGFKFDGMFDRITYIE